MILKKENKKTSKNGMCFAHYCNSYAGGSLKFNVNASDLIRLVFDDCDRTQIEYDEKTMQIKMKPSQNCDDYKLSTPTKRNNISVSVCHYSKSLKFFDYYDVYKNNNEIVLIPKNEGEEK